MSREIKHTVNIQATAVTSAKVSDMPTPEQIANATMRRLKAEILDRYDSVKTFAVELKTISYYGLNDNLKGKSDMKLSVLYECLAVLGMDQMEFTRRVMQDATSPR
jgi:hypothetical protein